MPDIPGRVRQTVALAIASRLPISENAAQRGLRRRGRPKSPGYLMHEACAAGYCEFPANE
jgi:hypothetical protein